MFARGVILFCCIWLSLIAGYSVFVFKELPFAIKKLTYFIWLSASIEIISSIMWWNKVNNMPLLHLYVAGGFVLVAMFYRETFSKFIDRKILMGVSILFVLFVILDILYYQSLFRFSSRALTVESVLIIIFSLFTYILLLRDDAKDTLINQRKSLLWINAGFLIYYASNLLIFYFGDLFTRLFPVALNQKTWVLHSLFSMTMYTCFFIALWKRPKQHATEE